jgi:hypothetical protein
MPLPPCGCTLLAQPAQASLEGEAQVNECLIFAVARPLKDISLHFEVAMHHGRDGLARLVLTFSYSLLQLLAASPPHPSTFEEWRLLRKDQLPGLHVSVPAPLGCQGAGVRVPFFRPR